MRYTLTITEKDHVHLRSLVLQDASEAGAILLCGRSLHVDPWSGIPEERFLCREVISVPSSAYVERSPTHLTWSTTPIYDALKRSERRGAAVAVVHSHPRGPLAFSERDDVAERETFQIAFNRLDSERPHLSVIVDGTGALIARAYGPDLKPHAVEVIRVIGERWRFHRSLADAGVAGAELDRQVRAFGAAATRDLSQLRIGIAGCGGTGSAVAMLLARMGARRFALFDTDFVDETNLNRLHFSTRADASLRELKVDVVARGIAAIGLPTSIVRVHAPIDSEAARDALRSCDVVFGCTDDVLGRCTIDRVAHFYLIPVIDMGLLIEPSDAGGYDVFDGRVTVLQPGYACLLCRRLISPAAMQMQALRRNDPVLHALYRRAGYVPSGTDPSPVVVSFTTEVATMAVNELLQRLTGFRGDDGSCSERVRRFHEKRDFDILSAGSSRPGCGLCDARKYDGRGDMTPFLDQAP